MRSSRMRPVAWSTSYLLRCPLGISIVTSNSTASSSRTGTATLGRWLGLWTTEPRRRAGTSVTRAVPAGGFPRARPAGAVSDNAHVPRPDGPATERAAGARSGPRERTDRGRRMGWGTRTGVAVGVVLALAGGYV